MKFKTVTHTDRAEWLQWRQNGIGSSDAPVIMGVSRFKTIGQLLVDKSQLVVTEDNSNGYIKDRGNRIEQQVRKFYEDHMGMPFKALSCEHREHPHLLATLDGIDEGCNLMIEIKLLSSVGVGKKVNVKAEGYKKWVNAKENMVIPADYYPQIQHQLMVTGMSTCVFLGLKEVRGRTEIGWDQLVEISVHRDEKYIQELKHRITIFWMNVLQRRAEQSIINQIK